MEEAVARIRPLLLLGGAALAVLALLIWSGEGQQDARAFPGLTAGIDMNPATTTDLNGDGIYETVDLTKFEACRDVTIGQQFNVAFFVLDVLDLQAFQADFKYSGSIVKVIAAYTGTTPTNLPTMFMSAQPLSTVQNQSSNNPAPSTGILLTPDEDGSYFAIGFDNSLTPPNGDDGSGTLVRLTLEAKANGVSPFNLDIIPAQLKGVNLVNVNGVRLNDANLDGLFDGPFINQNATISVGQPDQDGDGVQNPCDPDVDGDGICDVGGPLPPGTPGTPGTPPGGCTAGPGGFDNCPTISNPTQADVDSDGIGDPCDTWDADGDGYTNATETTYASNTLNPASRPEVCDGVNNDGDTLIDEGPGNPPTPFADINANTVPDCVDALVDTDGDTVVNTVDTDDDNDGTSDVNENVIGTDSLFKCHNGSGLPDWAQDFNNSKSIDILDVVQMTPPVFNSTQSPGGKQPYEKRKDLSPDGVIDILDIVRITPPVFGSICTFP